MSLTDEWVAKAESDFQIAVALSRLRKQPQYDGICYHCQQSAEKYLKAYLVSKGDTPRRIHDLVELLKDCAIHDSSLTSLDTEARILSPYSVEFRYPGDFATESESEEALKVLRIMRRFIRNRLGHK